MRFDSPLYARALAADDAYQAELERVYGRRACDARYDLNLNRQTEQLRALRDAKLRADAEWHAACVQARAVTAMAVSL